MHLSSYLWNAPMPGSCMVLPHACWRLPAAVLPFCLCRLISRCPGACQLRLVLLQVDKILGPGNQYVTAAKMLLQNSEAMVSIDMPAGPSEVLVIADAGAPHAHVAADLLSQAEHGPDSQATLASAVHCTCAAAAPA